MKYGLEGYYGPASSTSLRKVYVNMYLLEHAIVRHFNSSV